jgi:antitoxin CptB
MVISNNNLLGQDAKRYLRTCLESRYNETDMVDLREPQHSVLNINGAGSEKTVKNCFSFHSGKRSKSTIDDYCSGDSKQVLIKTLLYRSLHRGCKETDILLGLFAKNKITNFSDEELKIYAQLVLEDDVFIYDWILQKVPTPDQYKNLVQSIRHFHNL